MNQKEFDKIASEAFDDELNKIAKKGLPPGLQAYLDKKNGKKPIVKTAGEVSEVVGSALGFPFTALTGGIGYMMGPKSKAEMKAQDDADISNILLSPVAGYRLGRRLASKNAEKNK